VAVPVISSVATVPKASSVEAVLHERLMPDRLHRWMDVHHDVIRCRKLPQPFRLGAVEEDANRAVAIAGRQLPWRLADHLLHDGPTGLFEGVCVGRRYELAGIAIHDFHVFVVEKLETLVCAGLEQIPRKLRHLAAIGHEAEGNAPLALDRHDVVQIENLAIGHQVQGVSLRESLFRVEQASLLNFGLHLFSPRMPVGIDDCLAF